MRKAGFYISALLVLCIITSPASQTHKKSGFDKISFGVKIGILPTGKLTQFGLVYYQNKRLLSIQGIDQIQVIKIGTGEWPIPKTNIFHDFFKENGLEKDTLEDGTIIDYTAAFDSLWKIRFDVHPFDKKAGKGWSRGEFRPSLQQQAYIYDRYGIRGYDQDYFTDTAFFKLLKDVVNTDWIEAYKSMY